MLSTYHILAKKSIYCLLLAVFLLSTPGLALALTPNDPSYARQTTFYQQIGLPQAWDYYTGSNDVIVAVIDVGIDINHRDLADNIWQNRDEIAGNGLDDDGNGFIDDVNGWNFVNDDNQVSIPNAAALNNDDVTNHGSISAGIIGAVGNNGLDGAGINWSVRIMALRAIDTDGGGSFIDVINAIEYAIDNGADVISMSLVGDSNDTLLANVLRKAYDRGIVVVAAAGNDRSKGKGDLDVYAHYPICTDQSSVDNFVLGVTSVDNNDRLSGFANYGACVDIAAPGEEINSTLYSSGNSNYFGGQVDGTSFSVSLVAGAAAMIKGLVPSWGADKIINNLLSTTDKITGQDTYLAGLVGYGRLNLAKAVAAARADESFYTDSLEKAYYFQNNEIYSYNFKSKQSTFLDRLNDLHIISLAAADVNDDQQAEVVALVRRDKYNYLQILSSNGVFSKELYIGEGYNYGNIKVVQGDDKNYYVVAQQLNSGMRLHQYGPDGQEIAAVNIPVGAQWSVDNNNNIILGLLNQGRLTVKSIDWQGETANQWSADGVGAIYDLQTGQIWQGGRWEQAVLLNQQGKIKLMVLDLPSHSWRSYDVADYTAGRAWKMMLGPYGQVVLPYSSAGGQFSLLREGYDWAAYLELPQSVSQNKTLTGVAF